MKTDNIELDGGPAFPSIASEFDGIDSNGIERWGNGPQGGMSLRDYFAAAATETDIQAIMTNTQLCGCTRLQARFWHADQMLIARAAFPKLNTGTAQSNESLIQRVAELERWLDYIAAPNDPNRKELLNHAEARAESLQSQLDRYTRISESGESLGGELEEREMRIALQSQLAAAQEDARRYRWLREQHWNESDMVVVRHPENSLKPGFDCPSGHRLDEIIDSAIDAAQGDPS